MQNNFLDNPMTQSAAQSMSEDDKKNYKKWGEEMHEIDFASVNNELDAQMVNSVAFSSVALRSGLDPKELSKEEVEMMREYYGSKWYEKFDFTDKNLE